MAEYEALTKPQAYKHDTFLPTLPFSSAHAVLITPHKGQSCQNKEMLCYS